MKTHRHFPQNRLLTAISMILALFFLMVSSCNQGPREGTRPAQAQRGKMIFEAQCMSCHGLNDIAPTIDTLNPPAPDLTKIMDRRPKTKEFPIVDVARFIDGRATVKAHGPRAMPVWGEVYTQEGLDNNEIRGRKGELVAFLMSIQQ